MTAEPQTIAEPSARPWRLSLSENMITDADEDVIICLRAEEHFRESSDAWEANAALIVRAVNSHKRLIAIEQAARTFIDNCPSDDRDVPYLSDVATHEFRALIAALSQAGETP